MKKVSQILRVVLGALAYLSVPVSIFISMTVSAPAAAVESGSFGNGNTQTSVCRIVSSISPGVFQSVLVKINSTDEVVDLPFCRFGPNFGERLFGSLDLSLLVYGHQATFVKSKTLAVQYFLGSRGGFDSNRCARVGGFVCSSSSPECTSSVAVCLIRFSADGKSRSEDQTDFSAFGLDVISGGSEDLQNQPILKVLQHQF